MNKKFIGTDEKGGDKIIRLIREFGGLICVDPAPAPHTFPNPLKALYRMLRKKIDSPTFRD